MQLQQGGAGYRASAQASQNDGRNRIKSIRLDKHKPGTQFLRS